MKSKEYHEQEVLKYKEILKKDKDDFERELELMKHEHREDIDTVMMELSKYKEKADEEKRELV